MTTITLTFQSPTQTPDADEDVLASVLRDDGTIEVWEAHHALGTWWSSDATMIMGQVVSWARKPEGVDLREHERTKCDGNHGGPRCADPECWNDSPAQPQPVAIPAELRFSVRHRIVEDAGYKGPTAEHNAIIQGVLDHLRAPAQPATTEPGPTTRAEAEESDWRNRLTVNLLRQGAGLTKTQIRALISYAVDGVEPDPALFDTTERKGEPATIEDNSQQWAWMDGATAWHLIYRHADGWGDTDKMMGEWLKANTSPQAPEGFALLLERAQRLVEHADFKLAGVLSSESEVREIPSKAGSWVKARHLAALRDSVRALRDAAQAKEGGE